jgi:hypothetical protein
VLSSTKKIPNGFMTFILRGYDLDSGAPSTPAGGPSLAAALDAEWIAATLPEVAPRVRQLR